VSGQETSDTGKILNICWLLYTMNSWWGLDVGSIRNKPADCGLPHKRLDAD
jgi:hypothetical protein